MTSRYQNMVAAVAASENCVMGPWKGRRSRCERFVRERDLPANTVRLHPEPPADDEPLPLVPAAFLVQGAIFCALMDVGADNPAIRAVYEPTLDKLRALTRHEDPRVAANAMGALNLAFLRPYV